MKQIWKSKRAVLVALSMGSCVALGSPALAEGVVLSTETNSTIISGGITDAFFDLSVSNKSDQSISDMTITFDDGSSVYVGDLAGGSGTEAAVSMALDTTAMPTANFPVEVTLNYIQAAAVVEETSQIVVSLSH